MSNVELHKFSGTHYEIGVQQGKLISELMKKALAQIRNFEFIKNIKPRFMPFTIFLMIAKHKANKQLGNDIDKYYPNQSYLPLSTRLVHDILYRIHKDR